jgi:trigger factor
LKIETEIQEDHQAKLTVEVEVDVMEGMKRRAARKIARRVRIPGFRPGKAPYQVIVRQLGEGAILEEALEMLVEDIYPKIIEDTEIKPYGPGSLDNVVSLEPPVLEFMVPLDAEVTLGDYRSLRKPYEPSEVSDDDVNKVLENLRERQAVIEPVERPAQEGDLVTVRLSATKRTQVEDEDPNLISERSAPMIVRSSDESDPDEWPFPGFSANLVGLSEGDERTLNYVFPDDAEIEAFQGVEAEILFVVETVKARNLPLLDDEFASSMGDFADLDAFIQVIRSNLEAQAEQAYNESYDNEILDEVVEQAIFKYPPQMLESEIEDAIRDLTHRLEQQGLDMDLYLKTRSLDMDGLKEELEPVAENRLKRALFLYEMAEVENIEIEAEELKAEADSTMSYLSNVLPKEDARRLSDKDVYGNMVRNIMVDMLSRKAMERFRAICKGESEEHTEEEIETGENETVEPAEERLLDDVASESGSESPAAVNDDVIEVDRQEDNDLAPQPKDEEDEEAEVETESEVEQGETQA